MVAGLPLAAGFRHFLVGSRRGPISSPCILKRLDRAPAWDPFCSPKRTL